ncbi:MAG: DUF2325 domain-containing protein [Deltaproteobacteria bacterium]|nr:DUF2325 domain-containing protein [Deltaproteobacteria bacterium]
MSVLIIGADRIASLVSKMEAMGVSDVTHWDARRYKVSKNIIPAQTDLVIFFTDFLHHSVAGKLKKQVKSLGLPVIYSRRSWSDVAPGLQRKIDNQ